MRPLFISILLLLCLVSPLSAQHVRQGELNEIGLTRRKLYNAAQKQGRTDWTQCYDGLQGTQVQLSFSAKDADATIYTPINFGQTKLLEVCRGIAVQLHKPKADYITYASTKRAIVDIEFNKYLEKRPRQSDFYLDLPALAAALRRTDLPAPILISIETEGSTQTTIETPVGVRSLDEILFLSLNEIQPRSRLHFRASVTWQTYALTLLFGGLLLIVPASLVWGMARVRKHIARPEPAPASLPPDEVQRKYDKSMPTWVARLFPLVIPLLVFAGVFGAGGLRRGMSGIELLISFPLGRVLFASMVFMMLLVILTVVLAIKKKTVAREENTPETTSANRFVRLMLIPMCMMMLLPIVMFIPIYSPSGLLLRRNLVWTLIGIGLASMVIGGYRSWRQYRICLSSGPWYDLVQDTARIAGVSVQNVYLLPSSTLNPLVRSNSE